MKALTIYQPWASLLVPGEKQFETRSWRTAHRGLLAIHAGRKLTEDMRNLCGLDPFYASLKRHGIEKPGQLPVGALVGFVFLGDCVSTEEIEVGGTEEAFGDFRPGRWAWTCGNPVRLVEPIKYQGKLGLFDVPNETKIVGRPTGGLGIARGT